MQLCSDNCTDVAIGVLRYSYHCMMCECFLSTASQELQVTISPRAIASGSNDYFNFSCGAKNGQTLYNARYQYFINGMITAVSNYSHTVVYVRTTSNFTCDATQHTDLRTPIPSQLSPPVQATVLGEFTYYA